MSLKMTDRQMQIARLIDRGLTYEEMARELGISPSTVKTSVRDIRLKLGVSRKRHIPHVLKELGLFR